MSTREAIKNKILEARDLQTRPVSVPEWSLESGLFVKAMSLLDAITFDRENAKDEVASLPLYLALTLCDETGAPVYEDFEVGIAELSKRSPAVLERLFRESLAINGGSEEGAKSSEGESLPSP